MVAGKPVQLGCGYHKFAVLSDQKRMAGMPEEGGHNLMTTTIIYKRAIAVSNRHCANVGLMLGRRVRRRPNIGSTYPVC